MGNLLSITAFWQNDRPDGIAVQIGSDQWADAPDDLSVFARLIEADAIEIIEDMSESEIIETLRDLASRKDTLDMEDNFNVVSMVRALGHLGHPSDDFNGIVYMSGPKGVATAFGLDNLDPILN
jgi:hypothetical protein